MQSLSDLESHKRGDDFKSRKNRVFRSVFDGRDCVVKVYSGKQPECASSEYRMLSDCCKRQIRVPEPIARLESAIVMEYVGGENVADLFDRMCDDLSGSDLSQEMIELAEALAEWMCGYHRAFHFRIARGDAILRNFISAPDGIVGADLEESSETDTIEDVGQICSSILMTDPPFTEVKWSFARRLVKRYWECTGRDRSDELPKAIGAAMRYYAQFRPNNEELAAKAVQVENGTIGL